VAFETFFIEKSLEKRRGATLYQRGKKRNMSFNVDEIVDKPFPATAQDRESMSSLRTRIGDSSNSSNQ